MMYVQVCMYLYDVCMNEIITTVGLLLYSIF